MKKVTLTWMTLLYHRNFIGFDLLASRNSRPNQYLFTYKFRMHFNWRSSDGFIRTC